MTEIYILTDVEADGPIPGEFSMLSLDSIALDKKGEVLGEFYKKLVPLPTALQDKKTMQFWKDNPKAYQEATTNAEDPQKVMTEYNKWLKKLKKDTKKELVFIAYPVTVDFMFVYWYLIKFTGESPFGYSGLDMKTLAMSILKKDFSEITKNKMPKSWLKHPGQKYHFALQDAKEQVFMLIKMLEELKK